MGNNYNMIEEMKFNPLNYNKIFEVIITHTTKPIINWRIIEASITLYIFTTEYGIP